MGIIFWAASLQEIQSALAEVSPALFSANRVVDALVVVGTISFATKEMQSFKNRSHKIANTSIVLSVCQAPS